MLVRWYLLEVPAGGGAVGVGGAVVAGTVVVVVDGIGNRVDIDVDVMMMFFFCMVRWILAFFISYQGR
jgi:hypothetical protein